MALKWRSVRSNVNKIGEISIMKDMTSVATTMMTEEEKADLERQLNGENGAQSSSNKAPHPVTHEAAAPQPTKIDAEKSVPPDATPKPFTTAEHSDSSPATPPVDDMSRTKSPTPSNVEREKQKEAARKKKQVNAEQKEKLRSQELERKKRMEERIKTLTEKLAERLRPFVEAKHPGEKDDPETVVFQEKMRREAEDLKLESFGVEVSISPFRHSTI